MSGNALVPYGQSFVGSSYLPTQDKPFRRLVRSLKRIGRERPGDRARFEQHPLVQTYRAVTPYVSGTTQYLSATLSPIAQALGTTVSYLTSSFSGVLYRLLSARLTGVTGSLIVLRSLYINRLAFSSIILSIPAIGESLLRFARLSDRLGGDRLSFVIRRALVSAVDWQLTNLNSIAQVGGLSRYARVLISREFMRVVLPGLSYHTGVSAVLTALISISRYLPRARSVHARVPTGIASNSAFQNYMIRKRKRRYRRRPRN